MSFLLTFFSFSQIIVIWDGLKNIHDGERLKTSGGNVEMGSWQNNVESQRTVMTFFVEVKGK